MRNLHEDVVRGVRHALGIRPVYKTVDTCAAEFAARTPYHYSSYDEETEVRPRTKPAVIILGSGPNRIGQGIEFDYSCVHASLALSEAGYETVMVNCNPETVSTDYDTSDRLYFEPLTLEDVLEIYQQEKCDGVIVQFGGQTPLNLATALKAHGVNIIGTSPESIEIAEDRKLFAAILDKLKLKQPANRTALTEPDAIKFAGELGYPVLVRPSFVLGGRGMFILYSEEDLKAVVRQVFDVMPGKPVLIDKFLEDAIELDVDCISDGETSVIGGMLEHIEYAGVHSGDAAMVMPPHTLSKEMIATVRKATYELARELKVIGLMNVQFAIKSNELYVLEVNPRASRTVPFVAKAIGVPLAKLAAKVMTGMKLKDLGLTREQTPKHWCVKEVVLPFVRFPGATIALGPEMRSTGEVMGLDEDLGVAFAKAQAAAKPGLPIAGNVFLSVKDSDKPRAVEIARGFEKLGFTIYSTSGTAKVLGDAGVKVKKLAKIQEGRPNAVDLIKNGQIQMVINTPGGMIPRRDENAIRAAAYAHNVCIMTSITGAAAAVDGIRALKEKHVGVRPIQKYRGSVNVV
jgi:carbamoyl-phosphate synthase large subunit